MQRRTPNIEHRTPNVERKKPGRSRALQGSAPAYLALVGLSVVFVLPFVWMLTTSLTPGEEVLDPGRAIVPREPAWGNYRKALTSLPFHWFFLNTVTVAGLCVVGQVLSASLAAFAFARLRFPFREPLFLLVLSTMMLPPQVTMIPQFVLFAKGFGWVDSLKPLIVPAFFGGGAFFIFLLRQFFLTIPRELEEAARLDGCSTFGIYRHVVMPLSKPALITVALFSFIGHWNDFLGPLIYTQSDENKTLALGLTSFKGMHGTEYHLLMAASAAVLAPIVIIFFFAQKYFVEGIATTGSKG